MKCPSVGECKKQLTEVKQPFCLLALIAKNRVLSAMRSEVKVSAITIS